MWQGTIWWLFVWTTRPRKSSPVRSLLTQIAIEGSEGITAIAVNRDANLLAVANRTDHGMITVYTIQRTHDEVQLRRKVNLTTSEHTSKDFVSVCFGNESRTKSLISLGGPPDYYLIHWSWAGERGKVEAFQILRGGNAIYEVTVNPMPPHGDVVVTGNNTFKYYNLGNGLQQLKQEITAKENQGSTHYTTHVWACGKLYVCTNQGEMLLLDSKSCKGRIECSPNDGQAIEHAVASNKYLVTGGERNGLYFFGLETEGSKAICERRNKEAIRISSFLPELGNHSIRSLAISPNSQWLVVALENNQLVKADISISSLESLKFDYLHYNYHAASVALSFTS